MDQLDLDTKQLSTVLFDAYNRKLQLSKDLVPSSLEKEKAYQIQHTVTAMKSAALNEELKGYKISLTSKETQDLFQSDTPLYGALTTSSLNNGELELSSLLSPLIELELIFIAEEDLSVEDSVDDILRKTSVAPGIEVPDSRYEDWFPKITLGQVIADSAVAGKIVTGTPISDVTFDQLDNIRGTLSFNGEEIASNTSSEVLEHPVYAVQWLVKELASHGFTIEKGMSVSSGTFILPKKLEKGVYTAAYEGIGEVVLTVV